MHMQTQIHACVHMSCMHIQILTLSLLGNSSKSNMVVAVSILLIILRQRLTVPSCKTFVDGIKVKILSSAKIKMYI
jgi:hypothetical protein